MIERKPMGFGRLPIAVLLGSFATWAAVAAGLDGRTAPKTSGGSAVISGALVEAIGASCRLTLTESNILRNAESGMSFPITVARAAGGRILLVEVENMGVIRVYEASGTLQALLHLEEGRTWGAVILMHPWLADSTAVWDVGKDSLYVFPPELTSPRRQAIDVNPRSAVAAPDGGAVVNTTFRTADLAGFSLHRLAPTGVRERSFDESDYRYDRPSRYRRALAPAVRGGFWAASELQYELTRWSFDGELLEQSARDAKWFPPPDESTPEAAEGRPALIGIAEDAAGLVWTMTRVRDSRFAPSARGAPTGSPAGPLAYDSLFDTIVEVVDPDDQTVLASQRFEQGFLGWIEPGTSYSHSIGGFDQSAVQVWSIRMSSCE